MLTWSAGPPKDGVEANSYCVEHGAEVGPETSPSFHRQQGGQLLLWCELCRRRAGSAIDKTRSSRWVLARDCWKWGWKREKE